MKITLLLLIVTFFQLKAEVNAQTVTVVAEKASLTDIIAQIRQQTDYDFLYNNQTIKMRSPLLSMPATQIWLQCSRLVLKDSPLATPLKIKRS